MFKKIILTVALMVAFTATANAANMWGEYGADAQNTGQSKFVGPETADDTVAVPLNKGNVDSFISPVVDGAGDVYFLDTNWQQREYVQNPDTGNMEWVVVKEAAAELVKYSWDGTIIWTKELPHKCIDDYGTSSIALSNSGDKLFVMCSGRTELGWSDPLQFKVLLTAVNTTDASTIWQLPMNNTEIAAIGSITVDSNDNIYFLGTSEETYWDERYQSERKRDYHVLKSVSGDGQLNWATSLGIGRSYDAAGPVLTNDESSVVIYRYGKLLNVYGSQWNNNEGYIESVSTQDGAINWSYEIVDGGTGWQTNTSFAVDSNDTIWALSYYKDDTETCYGTSNGLFAIDKNGNLVNRIQVEADLNCGPHVAVGPSDTIYITYDSVRGYNPDTRQYETILEGGISAVDPVNGVKWSFGLPDSYEANATPAIDAQENIYFSASFGQILYKLDKDGNVVWEYNIDPNAIPRSGYSNYTRYCTGDNVSEWNLNNYCPYHADDHFNYGAMPVIGRAGSIYIASEKNMHIVKNNITEEAVIASIEELVTSGDLNTGNASAIISSIENAIDANTDNAHDNMLDATINKIEALVNSNRMDSASAQSIIDTLNLLK